MQDELELLKKDWQKQSEALPKLTAEDIDPMLHKKSSSIVKWIFIISLIEFAFWILATIFLGDVDPEKYKQSSALINFENYFLIVHFSFLTVFIIWFYLNFKKINAADNAKKLIRNIFRTRKTVQYYIYTSLILFAIAAFVTIELLVTNNQETFSSINPKTLFIGFIVFISFFILLFWALYKLIYGRLMKKLTNNYKELKKLEV